MREKGMLSLVKRIVACAMAAVVLVSGIVTDALAVHAESTGVTVTTQDEFLTALAQGKSPIIVSKTFSVGNGALEDGRMKPIEVPADTVIQGTSGIALSLRSPLQLMGDNVIIKDIEMVFESSTALGSVAHRELFLAGHSLTMDNVSTYLEGHEGSLGELGGSESELLPTVYAGGFEGATVGSNASLTIQNANEKTIFQAIYMGNDEGSDKKTAYTGEAYLKMGEKVSIRDGVFAELNSLATIDITGSGAEVSSNNVNNVKFYGNSSTTLTARNVSLNKASINNVGHLILDENTSFELLTGSFNNVTVKNGACLNLDGVQDVIASGDFTGGINDTQNSMDTRGVLVLNKEGSLAVEGTVRGETWFHTESKNFPGDYLEKTYINAGGCEEGAKSFALPDDKTGTYELKYENNCWSVCEKELSVKVAEAEVISVPSAVDVKLIERWDVPDETVPYCEIVWKDTDGNAIGLDLVDELWLYGPGTVIVIKSEFWKSETSEKETDWGTFVDILPKEVNDGKYYFYTDSAASVKSGKYTFLLCSEIYQGDLETVEDVKAMKAAGFVLNEFEVAFYNSANGENAPTPTPDPEPDPAPEPIDITGESVTVSTVENQTYTGSEICPEITVKNEEVALVPNVDYTLIYSNNVKAGEAGITVTGINNYAGTREVAFSILPVDINDERITVADIEDQVYTGEAIQPNIVITDNINILLEESDYSLTYTDNINVGTAKVTITGKGNYKGTREVTFNIVTEGASEPKPEPDPDPDPEPDPTPPKEGLWFEIIQEEEQPFCYTGKAIKPAVKVYEGEQELGTKDYKISYSNNKNAGTEAKITVSGKGNYTGKDTICFTIEKKDIEDDDIVAPKEVFSVIRKDGTVKNPAVTIKLGKATLKVNTSKVMRDYKIDYPTIPKDENGRSIPGKYVITVYGNGTNYKGKRTIVYTVIEDTTLQMGKAKISIAKSSPIKKIDYTKPDILPEFVVKIGKTELKKDIDYTIECPDFIIGKNVITFKPLESSQHSLYGEKNFTVTVTGLQIKHKDILIEGIPKDGYAYTGIEIIPGEDKADKKGLGELKVFKVTERDEKGAVISKELLAENVDYSLSYKNNLKVGKATVTITGINSYTGKRTMNFSIKKIDLKTANSNLLSVTVADSAVYNKNGAKALVEISYNGIPLVEKKDYTLAYYNHKKIGENTAKVIIKGKGNFTGTLTYFYSILPSADTEIVFEASDIVRPSTVTRVKPKFTVKEKLTGKALSTKTDYIKDVKYYSDEECTQEITSQDLVVDKVLWARIILKGNYGDAATTVMTDSFRLYETKASVFKVDKIAPQPYTGKPVTVDLDGKVYVYKKIDGVKKKVVLEEGTHYEVEYPEGKNVKAGTAVLVLHGVGEYGGTKNVSFRIGKKSMDFNVGEKLLEFLFS